MRRILKISFLSFLLFIPFIVKGASISDVSAAYGYQYYDANNTFHNYQWFGTYSSNNLTKYNYDLPTTYNGDGVQLVDFGIRFHINGNYKAGTNYTINFTWANYNGLNDVFLANFSHLIWYSKCRVSSWSSTAQVESYCYNDYNLSYTRGSLDTEVNVTFSFNAKVDFYGFSLYFYHDNDPYEYFYSDGWEITNISYSETTDSSQAIINNQNQNTTNIINNQNNNTSSIINNQNQNTQSIINNQNANTQAQIESQIACTKRNISISDVKTSNSYLRSNGSVYSSNNFGLTDYISILDVKKITLLAPYTQSNVALCFYNESKNLISCVDYSTLTSVGSTITIPNNSNYVRFSIYKNNIPRFELEVCKNGNQVITDTLTDDNVDGANSDANNFFSGFTTETYGLTGVITAPLNVIQSITSKTCSPLVLPLPFVNQNLTLPCMGEIYSQYFGDFLTIYQTITFGIVAYWVVVRIFNLVKDFKNPDHDEIEVLDL